MGCLNGCVNDMELFATETIERHLSVMAIYTVGGLYVRGHRHNVITHRPHMKNDHARVSDIRFDEVSKGKNRPPNASMAATTAALIRTGTVSGVSLNSNSTELT
jgi:hypothetical protein